MILLEKLVNIEISMDMNNIIYGLYFFIIIKIMWKKKRVSKNYNVKIGLNGFNWIVFFLLVK